MDEKTPDFGWPRSTARRSSSSTTTRCARTTGSSGSTCRACRSTTRSRPTASRRSCGRSTRPARASTWPAMAEFLTVHENVKDLPEKQRQDFIWDRIIYANPIKATETLEQLDPYKPLVTYDNHEESHQDRQARAARRPRAAAARAEHRLDGRAVEQVRRAAGRGGGPDRVRAQQQARGRRPELSRRQPDAPTSQNYMQALHLAAGDLRGSQMRAAIRSSSLLDIGGGFPGALRRARAGRSRSWPRRSTRSWIVCFPKDIEILAEPGRFLVASAATAVAEDHRQGRPRRQAVLLHQRRRLPHVQRRDLRPLPVSPSRASRTGPTQICSRLRPDLRRARHDLAWPRSCPTWTCGEFVYSDNIGAYCHAQRTYFNGFPPAKVVHVNR